MLSPLQSREQVSIVDGVQQCRCPCCQNSISNESLVLQGIMHTVTADESQVHMTMPQAEVQETPDTNCGGQ